MYQGGDLICNHLTIQQGFDHYSEFQHLFPTEKPPELPLLREPMEIMQYKIEVIEGAEWHPNYIPSYDRFQDQITEKINKELETGRIIPSKSLNTIIMFTQPKKDGKKVRFFLNCILRNLKRHKDRMPMPSINQVIDWLASKRFKADPEKIKKVVDFKTPTNRREIQRFMGVVNYLARFCKDLATKGRYLYELQGSTKQFKWTHLHNEAFKQVKELIMSNAMLKPINHDSNEQIYLITVASNVGISG